MNRSSLFQMKKCKFSIMLVFSVMLFSAPASGFSHEGLLDIVTGGGDAGSLVDQQSDIVHSMLSSILNLSKAQGIMADALGLKEEAAAANETVRQIESGEISGDDGLEKGIQSTESVNDKLIATMEEGTTLDANSKMKFATALPPYGVGAVQMVQTGTKALAIKDAIAKDPTALATLGNLVLVVTNAPRLIGKFTGATSSIVRFAQSNGIDTSELESKEDEMGD